MGREPMYLRFGYEIIFELAAPTPMLLMLNAHPTKAHALRRPERIVIEPDLFVDTAIDFFGNCIGRINAPAGPLRIWYDNVAIDSGQPETSIEGAVLDKVEDLPNECLPFLLASRYCEVERL